MSSAIKSVSPGRLSASSLLGFDFLYGVVPLLLLSPLLVLEFQALWQRTAMQFFPIPIFIVTCFAAWHWRSARSDEPQRVLLARGSFLLAVAIFGAAAWRFSLFLAHCSFVLLFLGWASERLGCVAGPRILGWSALLATSIPLPGGLQARLQEWLVQQSSGMLASILDGLSIPFLIQANSFSMRGLEFSIGECCASVYSINALTSAVVLILLLTHRSLLVAVLSLLTVPLWAIVQLVVLLLAIVFIKHFGERDASQGLDRALLEMGMFMLVVACCWATTWFLAKLFLPVPAADNEFEPEFLLLNSIACWPQPDPFAEGAPSIEPSERWQQFSQTSSRLMQRVSWAGAIGLVAIGSLTTYQAVYGRFGAAVMLPSIRSQQLASTNWKDLFPEVFDPWIRMEATHQIQRIDGSDKAKIEWNFVWQGQIVQLNITLPFNSHPELASKYEAKGWRVVSEQAMQYSPPSVATTNGAQAEREPQSASKEIQTWTELRIANELGGQAIALVAYHPLQKQDSTPEPQSESSRIPMEYQVTLFCESGEALTQPQLSELYFSFLKANEYLRAKIEPQLNELLGGAR